MLNKAAVILLVPLVADCASYKKPLPVVAQRATIQPVVFELSEKARQARLVAIVIDVPIGHQYGESAAGTGGRCYHKQPLVNTKGRIELDVNSYADVFNDAMKRHGYSVEEGLELFKGSKDRVADLQVAARIIGATLNECYPDFYDIKLKAIGSAYLKIEWSVYSPIENKVVLTTLTEGSTYGEVESTVGETGILRPALADAAERLAVTARYKDVIDPPKALAQVPPVTRIKIKRTRPFSGDLKSNMDTIKKAVATVTTNKGFGSGFVISDDGTILTAEHVVSGSKFVKVNTAAGKECYGEVMAASKQRDLAIVHVDCPGLAPLPLGRDKVVEGGEVFAIGTPLSHKLEFSVTRGIVSGIRTIDTMEYIQSDVTVLPGNSGGPLLDARGNVVGVANAIVRSAVSAQVGVNFFVPLADVEKYLPVELE